MLFDRAAHLDVDGVVILSHRILYDSVRLDEVKRPRNQPSIAERGQAEISRMPSTKLDVLLVAVFFPIDDLTLET